jgi:hypothetical protein
MDAPTTWQLSPTTYDVLRIVTWALPIVGLILLAVALINTDGGGSPRRLPRTRRRM